MVAAFEMASAGMTTADTISSKDSSAAQLAPSLHYRNRLALEPLKAAAEAGFLAWDDTRADAAGQLIEDIVWGVRPRG